MPTGQQLSLDQLARIASEQSGLPLAFTKALIAEEGTWQTSNNPFDVTGGWANLAGFGAWVSGLFGAGIATFTDTTAAIQAWWYGLSNFSNYDQFRKDQAAGATPYQLALDLQNAGYAGGDTAYAGKIATLYEQYSGQSAYAPLGKSVPTQATTTGAGSQPNTQADAGTPSVSPSPTSQPTSLKTPWTMPDVLGIGGAINNVANSVSDFGGTIAAIVSTIERFFWIVIGLILIIVGLWVALRGQGD